MTPEAVIVLFAPTAQLWLAPRAMLFEMEKFLPLVSMLTPPAPSVSVPAPLMVMSAVAPLGSAVHSGTFNAHTIPILAANAFLDEVAEPAFWDGLRRTEEFFYPALRAAFVRADLPVWVQAVGARFSLHFGLTQEPRSYRDAEQGDRAMATAFYQAAMERGVYFHHARHHGISTMHTEVDLAQALEAIEAAARAVRAS